MSTVSKHSTPGYSRLRVRRAFVRDIIDREQITMTYRKLPLPQRNHLPGPPGAPGTWSLSSSSSARRVDVLCLATTKNQIDVVMRALLDLQSRGIASHLITTNVAPRREQDLVPRTSLSDYRKANRNEAIRLLAAAPGWSLSIARSRPSQSIDTFRMIRDILAVLSALQEYSPKIVLISNDHSRYQRILLSICRRAGIEAAYVQHGSVSLQFPRLAVDYAFLDGRNALEIYEECAENHAPNTVLTHKPIVALTGIQRELCPPPAIDCKKIGIATNSLDDIEQIGRLAEDLVGAGYEVTLRWHPRQGAHDVARLQAMATASGGKISASNPQREDVAGFFSSIAHLCAGDSGILLEAAVSGRAAFYLRTSTKVAFDYYGFVAQGIALQVSSAEDIHSALMRGYRPDPNALKRMSATWDTGWFSREPDLLVALIQRILERSSFTPLLQRTEESAIAQAVLEPA